jgi:hypothetical protein
MSDLITLEEARAWGEKTKLSPAWEHGLDAALLSQVQVEVLGNVASVADTSTWIDNDTTPGLVKTIIAKLYVAWLIDRQYSEDEDLSAYAALLRASAMALQTAIVNSDIDLPGSSDDTAGDGLPSGFPTDTDPVEGPYFTMNAVF